MKTKIMVIMCALLLAMPVLSFAKEKGHTGPNIAAYEHANENAKFKRDQDLSNKTASIEIRAKGLAENKAAEEKKKAEEAQDKSDGIFRVKF